MRIPEFKITDKRAVRLAECVAVPSLMIIAGPNGCGKSTLLNELRNSGGRTSGVLYVGPARAMRKQTVQQRHLASQDIKLEEILTQTSVSGYEGINLLAGGSRDAWNVDDAYNYLKHGLCQIDVGRKEAITARFDRDQEILKGTIDDVWEPFRALTKSLLPHLEFVKIDTSNRDNIRCVWRVHGKPTEVDLDDLSSGEKSIIQMFYPLIEHRVREALDGLHGRSAPKAKTDLCVLIDEPELHLHPNLQMKVLDYLRVLAAEEDTQVIVATHSPSIVENASFEELFLMRPVELVADGENQLIPIAADDERLSVLRELFGSTSNLTAMQPVIIAEGVGDEQAKNAVGARKLFRALSQRFDGATVIPGGGKSECMSLRSRLSSALDGFSSGLKVFALVDQDVGFPPEVPEDVFVLPVSVVENFLIDPDAIWRAIEVVVEQTDLKSKEDVVAALDKISDEMEADEIERRVHKALGFHGFRPKRPLTELAKQVGDFIAELQMKFSAEEVAKLQKNAEVAVASIKKDGRRREFYDGKKMLETFHSRHIANTNLKRTHFQFLVAKEARGRKSVSKFFDGLFDALAAEK